MYAWDNTRGGTGVAGADGGWVTSQCGRVFAGTACLGSYFVDKHDPQPGQCLTKWAVFEQSEIESSR